MLQGRQVNLFHTRFLFSLLLAGLFFVSSCTVPKKYQSYKPFVYKTSIDLDADISTKDRQALKEALANQLDDSLKVRTVAAIRIIPPFFYNRLSSPPVFDSLYIGRSKTFMNSLLNSQGYFYPTITDTFRIDTVRDQFRTYIDFRVQPGKVMRLDSIGYDLQTPELQQLALRERDKSLLLKNSPYSLQNVSAEIDRLLNVYRNNGYYKITKEDIYAEHDTVAAALIDPSLDPFEQLALLDSLAKRTQNPTIDIVFKQRPPNDSSHLHKYYIGDVTVYPDLSVLRDTIGRQRFSDTISGYKFFHNSRRFKLPFVARNVALKPGSLYRLDDYFKTINTFTNLGAWQQVDIDLTERSDSSRRIDALVQLYPARRRSLNIDFESSRNVSDALTIGSFFGIGLNVGVLNRNAFRESIQTSTNARFGVELGRSFIQTVQTTVAHTISVPRFLLPFRVENENIVAPRTIISANAGYTNRRDFFDVRSINASWGYEWSKRNNKTWQFIPFNFELTDVGKTDSLTKNEIKYPALRYAFNNGIIVSQILSYGSVRSKGNNRSFFRARVEQSGAITGLIKNFDRRDLNRFIRTDAEYKYFIGSAGSTWAFRIFGGYGYSYGKAGDSLEYVLPFFKSYFAGGPYSMRAWRVRQLGLGSSTRVDSLGFTFGDIQLEGNIEYRFDIGRFFGIKVESALFTDIGNVWIRNARHDASLEGAEFKFNKLFKDLAIGAGTSLRFDFEFFLIRLDWAYKIKNPALASTRNGWFQNLNLDEGQFQLGIGYPF